MKIRKKLVKKDKKDCMYKQVFVKLLDDVIMGCCADKFEEYEIYEWFNNAINFIEKAYNNGSISVTMSLINYIRNKKE